MTATVQLSERFKPVRAGLLNLFEYGNQVFEFADGHLLLRGHNGAGKSKALELLLPFVLDGDTHPNKLDPFATSSREMKWNLTLGGRHESRWGYAWLEFGRQRDGAQPEWVTLAVGVRAHHQTPGSTTWFLVIPDRRVGYDISLLNPQSGTPVLRRGIRDLLGDDVEVFDEAYAYRERVNDVLFGFPTVERYETMLELQRQLRRPQLSKSLNPQELSDILTDALPEVDGRLITDIGAHLDAIEQLRHDLRSLSGVRDGFKSFVETYQTYARAVVAERASEVLDTDRQAREAQAELDTKQQAAQDAAAAAQRLADEVGTLGEELQRKRGAEQELLRSDAVRSARELAELREHVAELTGQVAQLVKDCAEARDAAKQERRQRDEQRREQERAVARAGEVEMEMRSLAVTAGLAHHELLAEQLRASKQPQPVAKTMRDAGADRRRDIARQRELRVTADRRGDHAADREDTADRAARRVRDTEGRLAAVEDEFAAQRQRLTETTQEWTEQLEVLVLSVEQTERLLDTAAGAGSPDVRLRGALDEPVRAHDAAWLRDELGLQAEQQRIADERAPLHAEREALEAQHDPEPEPLPTHTADRTGRPGAPLWRLVDFRDDLPAEHRAGLEAALQAAGLLDAWVLPSGQVLDIDGDVALTVGQTADGATLGRALRAVDGEVAAPVVDAVLAAIGLDDSAAGAGVRVDVNGSFRMGPAVGRYSKPEAQFIGASAREANRARRLAELAELMAELDRRDGEAARALEAIEARRATMLAELAALPAEDGTRSAFAAVRDIERHLTALRPEAEEARGVANTANEAAAQARKHAADHAREHALPAPGAQPPLEALDSALADYGSRLGDLVLQTQVAAQHAAQADACEERADRADRRADHLDEQRRTRAATLQARSGAMEVLDAAKGEDAEAALARLAELQQEITALDADITTTTKRRENAAVEHAKLTTAIEAVELDVTQRRAERENCLERFRALESPDFLRLAVEDAAPDAGDVAHWDAPRVQQFARANSTVLRPSSSVEALTNRVEADYTRLLGELDGSVGVQPFRQRQDGLDVVAATRGGRQVSVRVLLFSLDEEIEAQQRNLTEADQRTFERFLFNGIAQHLRARIGAAHRLVEDTNSAIASCQTSSGMSVELDWQPLADDEPLLRRALVLLKSAPEALTDSERDQLVRFFRERVEDARMSQDAGTATEHLLGALDYRRWHRFRVLQTKDGVKVPLTKKQHEAGSGGEKAATLHLPLFAAAAAQMQSAAAHAPRLVMLDEAFAGIDGKMRPQLLGLIESFDLDFLLTSHELWCCERELEHLSIYQLHREEGTAGVASVHFLWDGAAGVRREVDGGEGVAA